MNPAFAIISLVIYSISIAFRETFYFTDLIPIVFAFFISDIDIKKFVKRILILNIFIAFLYITIVLSYKDYEKANMILIRSNLLIALSVIIFNNKNSIYCYFGFNSLKFPKKFNLLLFFTIKYIEILFYEYKTLKNSLKLRNFKMKTDLFTYKIFGFMIGMIFMKTIQKANSMQEAMILRGFNGNMYSLYKYKISKNDIIIISSLFLQIFFWLYYEL